MAVQAEKLGHNQDVSAALARFDALRRRQREQAALVNSYSAQRRDLAQGLSALVGELDRARNAGADGFTRDYEREADLESSITVQRAELQDVDRRLAAARHEAQQLRQVLDKLQTFLESAGPRIADLRAGRRIGGHTAIGRTPAGAQEV